MIGAILLAAIVILIIIIVIVIIKKKREKPEKPAVDEQSSQEATTDTFTESSCNVPFENPLFVHDQPDNLLEDPFENNDFEEDI